MTNYTSSFKTLNSKKIPYEVRRNPINIYNFKNIVYNKIHSYKHKCGRYNNSVKLLEEFLYNNKNSTLPNDCKVIFELKDNNHQINISNIITKKVYLYKVMSLDNIGHFYIDNLIPIIKMIFIDQNILNNQINNIDRDNYIIFLNTHGETPKQQKMKAKHIEYLLPFTKNKIQFLSDYPDKTLFKDIVISTLGIGQPESYMDHNNEIHTWYKYNQPIDENINKKFIQTIKQIYFKFYNIYENNNPQNIVILSRANAKHRRILNEPELFNTLKEMQSNVKLIKLENFNLKDELQLLNNVSLFISPHGAGAISAFFIPAKSNCLIIHPKGFSFIHDFPTMYKTYLNRSNINVIQYLNDAQEDKDLRNIFKNRDKNFILNLTKINEIVKKLI